MRRDDLTPSAGQRLQMLCSLGKRAVLHLILSITAIPLFAAELSDQVTVKYYFPAQGTQNPTSDPNWFYYWADALGISGQITYNPSLSVSKTFVLTATSWTIEFAPETFWANSGGNPPTGKRFINGFKATSVHEFHHRDHRVHNLSVHGSWDLQGKFDVDFDQDDFCDREPTDPPRPFKGGGLEASLGLNPDVPNNVEDVADAQETKATFGHESVDWACPGSQLEPCP